MKLIIIKTYPSTQIIFTALATIVEFETAPRRERQQQRIEAIKEKNKSEYIRRNRVITKDLIKTIEKYEHLGVSVDEITRITSRS